MRHVRDLSAEEVLSLEAVHRGGTSHRERMRAHALLLSAGGMCVEELARIFFVDRDTVCAWLDRFEDGGVAALGDAPKPGRPHKVNACVQEVLHQALQQPTPRLAPLVREELQKKGSRSRGRPSSAP